MVYIAIKLNTMSIMAIITPAQSQFLSVGFLG